MTNRDRILDFVRQFPGRDDDEISTVLRIKPRQSVNQVCRALVKAGLVERRPGPSGKVSNFPRAARVAAPIQYAVPKAAVGVRPHNSVTPQEWYWEGHVTDAVAAFLVRRGWSILSQADTSTRERGLDLHAARGDQEIVIEAKGYPTTTYRDPARAGEIKPTSPTLQAQHWFAHALFKAVRLQAAYPSATVAIALPDFPRYRSLFQETSSGFDRLGIAMLFVTEEGTVHTIGL